MISFRLDRTSIVILGLGGLLATALALGLDDANVRPNEARGADVPQGDKIERDKFHKAVELGLEWLALHQARDGHWGLNDFNKYARTAPMPRGKSFVCSCIPGTTRGNDVVGTAFGLLPFLSAGQKNKPSLKAWPRDYSKTVTAGLSYLLSRQARDGSFSRDMYANSITTLTMCEAYGLTADPRLKRSAQLAIKFLISAQDPTGGGWRYSPRMAGDLSVTGWHLTAIKSAQMAGLTVPKVALSKAEKFVASCATPAKGGYAYLPGTAETPSMTAVGLLCRQHLGVNPRNESLLAGVERLKKNRPGKARNVYYEYYASQVMHHMAGANETLWFNGESGILENLLGKQEPEDPLKKSHQKGSWSPAGDPQGGNGGRMMQTSLSLVILQMRDQKLPLFRRDLGVKKGGK